MPEFCVMMPSQKPCMDKQPEPPARIPAACSGSGNSLLGTAIKGPRYSPATGQQRRQGSSGSSGGTGAPLAKTAVAVAAPAELAALAATSPTPATHEHPHKQQNSSNNATFQPVESSPVMLTSPSAATRRPNALLSERATNKELP